MNKAMKKIVTILLFAVLLFTMQIPAFAASKTLTYRDGYGGQIVGEAKVTFKNSGLRQSNTIIIKNNSCKQIYVVIDGAGYYIDANRNYKLSFNAYFGVTTTTKIKIQSQGAYINPRSVVIDVSKGGTVEFTKTLKGSTVK
ncbi:MAG: hypothetical protein J6X30_03685 [Clostridia bacterium]|nr:hypothetical protein [Clostridia bacterium]